MFGLVLAAEPCFEQSDVSTHCRLFFSVSQNLFGDSNQTSTKLKQHVGIVPFELLRTVFEPRQESL